MKIKSSEIKISEKDEFIFNLKHACSHNVVEDSQQIKDDINKILLHENLVQNHERPDILFFDGVNIIGIEQMDFSSYKHIKKRGDIELKKRNDIFDNSFKKYIKKQKNYLKNKIAVLKCSNENYEKSFIDTFDNHYKKVDKYISNLNKFNKPIKIYFLMTDRTFNCTKAKYKGKIIKYNPTYNKKILEYISEKNKIDGFIFEEPYYEKREFYYLKNDKKNIEGLLNNNKEYFKCQILKNKFKMFTFCGGVNLC